MYCPAPALRESITIACSYQARWEVYVHYSSLLKIGTSKANNLISCFHGTPVCFKKSTFVLDTGTCSLNTLYMDQCLRDHQINIKGWNGWVRRGGGMKDVHFLVFEV